MAFYQDDSNGEDDDSVGSYRGHKRSSKQGRVQRNVDAYEDIVNISNKKLDRHISRGGIYADGSEEEGSYSSAYEKEENYYADQSSPIRATDPLIDSGASLVNFRDLQGMGKHSISVKGRSLSDVEDEKDAWLEKDAVDGEPEKDIKDEDYKEVNAEGESRDLEDNSGDYDGNDRGQYIPSWSNKRKNSRFGFGMNVNRLVSNRQNVTEFHFGDEDFEEEEEDDDAIEDDDPADVDFDPRDGDLGASGRRMGKHDDDYDNSGDDYVEEDEEDESLDLSDESDEDYKSSKRKTYRKQTRSAQNLKDSKNRSIGKTPRFKRARSVSDYDESSGDDGDEESDEDYARSRKATTRGKGSGYALFTTPSKERELPSRETRTSSRVVPRKSYAEVESDAEDKERVKKQAKVMMLEEAEDDDGDAIERVLWHQPRGIAEAEYAEGRQAEPFVLDTDPHAELRWEEQEFYIKWKGQSYLHCQWVPLSELFQLSGYKKVLNYMKRIEDERSMRQALSREEAELHDVSKEMELDLLKQYRQVERVFAERTCKNENEDEIQEYLVKWKGLSYAESTWEKDIEICFAQDAIDDYKAREAATIQGNSVESQRKKGKVSLRRLEEQPEWLKGGQLRDYQLEGLNFLVNSWRNDTNVILADEMGLGKTVQSVSILGFLQYAQQIHGPFLIVVPLSTITNWAKEFRKWLPDMNVVVYVGTRASREVCQKYEFHTNKKTGRLIKFDALLTTYEVVLKDKAVLSRIRWNYMMVDEAHRLKNSEASLYTTLSEFMTKNTLLITGTPLQNSVEELWALLHFLDAFKFKNKEDFVERYKNLSSFNEIELANLHKELRPHLLRRVIKDVEKSLPPKIERILRVEMSPLQKQYYKWILERNFHDLNKGVRGNQVSLLNIVVELKKCCNHPFLFESADHGYGGDAKINDINKVHRLVLSSGKLVILDKLLLRLKETNHRVLIFSQMVKMLDILAEYLRLRGFQFQRLDGSTRADLRHQAMEHFNAPGSEDFCFLLSTRAGGLGINLATADTVIIFDSDWNPQNDLQAMSRAHRIGQQEVVNIYRFVTCKSVEEDILERAKKKMVLDHLVIQRLNAEGRLEKKETKKGTAMFDKNELAAILRFGAEELFKDDKTEDEAKSKLENLDIDEILARAEKVESKDGDAEDTGNELLSAFKVANFSNTEDDTTFWSRLIQPEATSVADVVIGPRAARKARNYAEELHSERRLKRRGVGESKSRASKRTRVSEPVLPPPPKLEGATARVAEWQGGALSKKDANAFIRAVKKFGDQSRIGLIARETGGIFKSANTRAQVQLWEAFMNGCQEALKSSNQDGKGAVLDFFGVAVKAHEVLERIKELTYLVKRVKRFPDPVTQFRLKSHPRNPPWSKSCGWTQVDDSKLLLGVYFHGHGSWEKIRIDNRLGLSHKIAPAGVPAGETYLPRAPNLDGRVNALLRKELETEKGVNGTVVVARPVREKAGKKRNLEEHGNVSHTERSNWHSKAGYQKQRGLGSSQMTKEQIIKQMKMQSEVKDDAKEEGEISDTDEPRYKEKLDQEAKEERWREWCETNMFDQLHTLRRLQKLQSTSSELPKDEVLYRVKKYLKQLGKRIETVLDEHRGARNLSKIATRLWNYVATFSNLSGERLSDLYKKLKQEAQSDRGSLYTEWNIGGAVGPSGRDGDQSHAELYNYSGPGRRLRDSNEVHDDDSIHGDAPKGDMDEEDWKHRRRPNRVGLDAATNQGNTHSRRADCQDATLEGRDRPISGRERLKNLGQDSADDIQGQSIRENIPGTSDRSIRNSSSRDRKDRGRRDVGERAHYTYQLQGHTGPTATRQGD